MRDRPSQSDAHRTFVGRRLGPTEVVHHRNEDKADASPANLEGQDRGEHTRHHNRERSLSQLRRVLRMTKERRKLY